MNRNERSAWEDFLSAICAGAMIGLGATVYLNVGGVAGAFLFGIGLFIILKKDLRLYTGRVCVAIEGGRKVVSRLPLIWMGNFVGALLFGGIVSQAGMADASSVVAVKLALLEKSPVAVILRGFVCNICIYLSVRGHRAIPDPVGKTAAVFLGVMAFILCGAEHCVADMFYFAMKPGAALRQTAFLVCVTLGNTVGAVVCELCSILLEDD